MRKLIAVAAVLSFVGAAHAQLGADSLQLAETDDTAAASMSLSPRHLLTDYDMFYNPASTLETGSIYGEVLQGTLWGGATFKLPMGMRGGFFGNRPVATGAGTHEWLQSPGAADDSLPFGAVLNDLSGADAGIAGDAVLATPGNDATGITGAPVQGAAAGAGVSLAPAYNQRFDTFLAIPLMDNKWGVGLRFSFLRSDNADPYVSNVGSAHPGSEDYNALTQEVQFGAGARMKGDGGMLDKADFVFNVSKPSLDSQFRAEDLDASVGATRDFTDLTLKDDGALNWNIGMRAVMNVLEEEKLVTNFQYHNINYNAGGTYKSDFDMTTPALDVDRNLTFKETGSIYLADGILHLKPNDALRVYTGLGVEVRNFERKYQENDQTAAGVITQDNQRPEDTIRVPVYIAFQHQTFSRVKTRAGIRHNLVDNVSVDVKDATAAGALTAERQSRQSNRGLGALAVSAGVGITPTDNSTIDLGVDTATKNTAGAATQNLTHVVARASLKYAF